MLADVGGGGNVGHGCVVTQGTVTNGEGFQADVEGLVGNDLGSKVEYLRTLARLTGETAHSTERGKVGLCKTLHRCWTALSRTWTRRRSSLHSHKRLHRTRP